MPTTTKPKPDQIYICVESFAGDMFAVAEGTRLRGDHELVQRFPDRFVEDGTPEEVSTSCAPRHSPRYSHPSAHSAG
jgi:hypothetical protein